MLFPKTIAACTLVLILTISSQSKGQITILPYPVEIRCDVDGVMEIQPVEAKSTSGKVSSTMNEEIFSGGCLGTLVRTYRFKDEAGNAAEAQQFIHLTDNEAPVLYGEAPNISTTEELLPEPAMFASRDNSGKDCEVIYQEKKEDHRITRTWTCTDACGNVTVRKQVITIE